MGRLTEYIDFLNREKIDIEYKQRLNYIEVTEDLKALRRKHRSELRKQKKVAD